MEHFTYILNVRKLYYQFYNNISIGA